MRVLHERPPPGRPVLGLLHRVRSVWSAASRAATRQGAVVVAVSLGALLGTATWVLVRPIAPADVEETALLLQRDALQALVSADPEASLVPPGGFLVAVREELIGKILREVLPYEQVFGESLSLRLDSATVVFDRGLASIQLHGRGGLVESRDVFADMTVVGALLVEGVADDGTALQTRAEVLGFRFEEVEIRGIAPPLRRAADRVATEIVTEVGHLLRQVEIPVKLIRALDLPAVEDDDVSIEAATIPVEVKIQRVVVQAGRMWISLAATVQGHDAVLEVAPSTPEEGIG